MMCLLCKRRKEGVDLVLWTINKRDQRKMRWKIREDGLDKMASRAVNE